MIKLQPRTINIIGDIHSLEVQSIFLALELKQQKYEFLNTPNGLTPELVAMIGKQCNGVSPYFLPVLVSKNTVTERADLILDYLDDFFCEPNLLPDQPVTRSRVKQVSMRTTEILYPLYYAIVEGIAELRKTDSADRDADKIKAAGACRLELESQLHKFSELVYNDNDFFLYDQPTVIDMAMIPILNNLNNVKLKLDDPKLAGIRKHLVMVQKLPFYKQTIKRIEAEKDNASTHFNDKSIAS